MISALIGSIKVDPCQNVIVSLLLSCWTTTESGFDLFLLLPNIVQKSALLIINFLKNVKKEKQIHPLIMTISNRIFHRKRRHAWSFHLHIHRGQIYRTLQHPCTDQETSQSTHLPTHHIIWKLIVS